MEDVMQLALILRQEHKLEQSNELLLQLVEDLPHNAFVNYQCAWSFDMLGKEAQAVPYYEQAIALGLQDDDLQGAYIGFGSTLRTLGRYTESEALFERATAQFPANLALQTFYAMTLFNVQKHEQAMGILLTILTKSTTDPSILSYAKAINFYADKLNTTWK